MYFSRMENQKTFFDKRDILYFCLSILLTIHHSYGYYLFQEAGVSLSKGTLYLTDYFTNFLAMFTVPAFLFFSGFLYFRNHVTLNDICRKFKSRIIAVICPYFIWNIVGTIYAMIINYIPIITNNVTVKEPFSFSIDNVFKGIFLYEYSINWYLFQLIIFMFISPLIYVIVKNKYIGIMGILMVLLIYYMGVQCPLYNYRQDAGIYYLLGAYIGYHYYDYIANYTTSFPKWVYGVFIVAFFLIPNLFSVTSKMITVLVILLEMGVFWVVLDTFKRNNYEMPLCLQGMHFFIFEVNLIYVMRIVGRTTWFFVPRNDVGELVALFGNVIISVVVMLLVGNLLRRYCPKFWNVINGGR